MQVSGYFEKSYYVVPDGFALATRLEQISQDGVSKAPPARWSAGVPGVEHFSISDYLRALLTANPGYYRVVVFVVTDVPFTESGPPANMGDAQKWLTGGANVLPVSIASTPFGPNTVCTALIYEFTRSAGKDPALLLPSPLDAHTHLVKSGLWNALGGQPMTLRNQIPHPSPQLLEFLRHRSFNRGSVPFPFFLWQLHDAAKWSWQEPAQPF